jgi:hypothetical protein
MAFVHGFENDVFISYAHADNEVDALGDAWVHQFQQNLRIALKQRLGRGDEINIYFDARRLQGNHPLDEILDSVRKSAVFLAVGSPSYVTAVDADELAAFVAVSDDPPRLFALERLPLDPGSATDHLRCRINFWRDQRRPTSLTLTPRLNTALSACRPSRADPQPARPDGGLAPRPPGRTLRPPPVTVVISRSATPGGGSAARSGGAGRGRAGGAVTEDLEYTANR